MPNLSAQGVRGDHEEFLKADGSGTRVRPAWGFLGQDPLQVRWITLYFIRTWSKRAAGGFSQAQSNLSSAQLQVARAEVRVVQGRPVD